MWLQPLRLILPKPSANAVVACQLCAVHDGPKESVPYEKYQELLYEVQSLKEQLSNERKEMQELRHKVKEGITGGYAVLWFENNEIVGSDEYATEEEAVAGFKKQLTEVDIGTQPSIESRNTYIFVQEDPEVSDPCKEFSFLLCGLSRETARKQSQELRARFNLPDSNSEPEEDDGDDDDDDDEEDM